MLDLTSYKNALAQVDESLQYCASDMARQDAGLFRQLRAGAIQAFEYTFEMSIKMLRRQLEEETESAEAIDHLSYRDLLRLGAEKGLIDDPAAWFGYREKRNITSHTYDESKAAKILAVIPEFKERADFLLAQLRKRNG